MENNRTLKRDRIRFESYSLRHNFLNISSQLTFLPLHQKPSAIRQQERNLKISGGGESKYNLR